MGASLFLRQILQQVDEIVGVRLFLVRVLEELDRYGLGANDEHVRHLRKRAAILPACFMRQFHPCYGVRASTRA